MSLPIPRRADLDKMPARPTGVRRVAAGLPVCAVTLLLSLVMSGCAASGALHRGRDAEIRQDYDRAVAEYTKALRLKPNDTGARTALERARLRSAEDHFQRGRRLAAVGK